MNEAKIKNFSENTCILCGYFLIKKRHPKVPSSDLNHFNFNNMYWTPIQILFYHVNLFCSLRKNKCTLLSAT
ncbi:hypothetical protein COJ38_21575 [Bacillus cereus]|uniref:Uncharacterized protein n=1 Tax=Bacillus cereus TaxID=1396 RepID=A0A9X6UIU8_BACCE|nr:hypothetical protein CN475_22040 [Bacillus cereus]PET50473.1 hypothetical protein CN521_14210 [Bacillus cereus]PFL86627.1 hypothetical protein COJ38_21575 [Bacillus cereus]